MSNARQESVISVINRTSHYCIEINTQTSESDNKPAATSTAHDIDVNTENVTINGVGMYRTSK